VNTRKLNFGKYECISYINFFLLERESKKIYSFFIDQLKIT